MIEHELFMELFNDDGGLKPSSPKLTPFSEIPEHRRKVYLPQSDRKPFMDCVTRQRTEPYAKYNALITPSKAIVIRNEISPVPFVDFVVIEKTLTGSSKATQIELKFPNGWSAEDTIGKDFGYIHDHVLNPNGNKVMPKPEIIVDRCINAKEPMERIGAISFRDNNEPNRHPADYTPDTFDTGELYLRFERQVVIGFPKYNGFFFGITTYFADLSDPNLAEIILKGIYRNGENSYAREVLGSERGDRIKDFLHRVISMY